MTKFVNENQDIASSHTSQKSKNEATTLTVSPKVNIESEDSDEEILTMDYLSDSVGEYQNEDVNSYTSSIFEDETYNPNSTFFGYDNFGTNHYTLILCFLIYTKMKMREEEEEIKQNYININNKPIKYLSHKNNM